MKICNVNALLFESLAGVQNSFMFDKRSDDMWSGTWRGSGRRNDAEDSVIVGLRAATGEENLLGACRNQCSDMFARGFHSRASFLAVSVDRGGIAELPGEVGKHRVEHLRLDGSGGVIIEVNAVHVPAFRIAPCGWEGKDRDGPLRNLRCASPACQQVSGGRLAQRHEIK